MNKITTLIVLTFLSASCFSQNFVGKHKWDVLTNLKKTAIYIDSPSRPLFGNGYYQITEIDNDEVSIRYSFKDDTCKSVSYTLPTSKKSLILSEIKKNKNLVYNVKEDAWIDTRKKIKWYTTPEDDKRYTSFTCTSIK